MKIFYFILLIFLISCLSANTSIESDYTIIEEVSIIDVVNGNLIPNKTVIIKDSIIYKICDEYSDTDFVNANLIDGSGQYIMPGLWDMHFHLCWEKSNDSLLFNPLLSYGITGIRDMGGDLKIQNHFKNLIKSDPTLGPNIYGAGPIFDGNPPVFYDFTVPLDENSNSKRILDSTVSSGSDFIKTYSLIKENELEHISSYSRSNHIHFAGHLSELIEPEISIKLGQKSVEHLNRLEDIWENNPARIDSISRLMKKSNSWLCPTLIIYYVKANMSDSSTVIEKYNSFIHPLLMQEWLAGRAKRLEQNKDLDSANLQNKLVSQFKLFTHMYRNGVKILAGSDFAGMPYVYPGIGLHHELILLHKAGLSNAEVLASATIDPAIYLSIDNSYGSVSEGKIADLVLLMNNPLENIANTQTIKMVFRKGKKIEKLIPTLYIGH